MKKALSLLVGAAVITSLGGCISLFPKADPVQMYRLSPSPAPAAAAPAPGDRVDIALAPVEFPRDATGDRILTVTGQEAAYIADARWVAPAQVMFAEALDAAFARQGQTVRLNGRGEGTGAPLLLDVDVRSFETRYDHGPDGAPTVVVALDAKLLRHKDRTVVAERVIEKSRPADQNRVRAIVPAYQAALDEALGELVSWTESAAAARGGQ